MLLPFLSKQLLIKLNPNFKLQLNFNNIICLFCKWIKIFHLSTQTSFSKSVIKKKYLQTSSLPIQITNGFLDLPNNKVRVLTLSTNVLNEMISDHSDQNHFLERYWNPTQKMNRKRRQLKPIRNYSTLIKQKAYTQIKYLNYFTVKARKHKIKIKIKSIYFFPFDYMFSPRLRQKEDRKYNMKEEDELDQEPIGNDKLSKNRESAKNSRKRKKMYIELLETKVSELQEQLKQVRQLCQHYQECISRYFGSFDLFEELIMIRQQWSQKANQLLQDEDLKNLQELQVEEIRIQDTQRQVNQNIINKMLDNLYPFPLNYMLDEQLNSEIQWQQSQLEKYNFVTLIEYDSSILQIGQNFNETNLQQNNLLQSYRKMINQMDAKNYFQFVQLILDVNAQSIKYLENKLEPAIICEIQL